MSSSFIEGGDFPRFVDAIIGAKRVIGPVAKRSKFVYAELESAAELRLDFDVTLLPPKKVFFPPVQDVVRWDAEGVRGCIDPVETVLLGVHFYDVRGIDIADTFFRNGYADADYLAQREATTIVASNVQNVSPRAFWASPAFGIAPTGHDAFLTAIDGGYVLETRTPKGEALLAFGHFRPATAEEVSAAAEENARALEKCQETLPYTAEEIATKVRESFGNEKMWDELARDCFSCGSCNIVCPTCYCFGVSDQYNLDQESGRRHRHWDACMTWEFASVTQAGGEKDNFREHYQARFRHRFMRKTAYQYDLVGGLACTGCGRCSQVCTADIANPARVITKIMEVAS